MAIVGVIIEAAIDEANSPGQFQHIQTRGRKVTAPLTQIWVAKFHCVTATLHVRLRALSDIPDANHDIDREL